MFWNMGLILKLLTLGFVLSSDLVLCDETQQFKEQTAIEGTSYKMKCTSVGSPQGQEPSLTSSSSSNTIVIWSVNGQLPKGPKYKMLTDGLVIRNVIKEDSFANYTCTILNRFSFTPLNSENIRLKLRQREGKLLDSNSLMIGSTTEKNVWGIVNQWVKLQCNVLSRPMPSFEWRNEQNGEKIRNASNVYKIFESEFTSNLTVFIHNETFFGRYICEASNDHGSVMQHFILSEGYKPKSPFIYPVFIGKDKLTLKVEPQETFRKGVATMSPKEKLPIINYIIQYTEASSLPLFASGEFDIEKFHGKRKKWTTVVNTMSADGIGPYITKQEGGIFELRNLKENITYLVLCAVANAAAISDFSPAIRITTEQGLERTVLVPSKTLDAEDDKVNQGEDYGKSSSYKPENISSALMSNDTQQTSSNHSGACKTWRYKKTTIKTTTITTMIENLNDESNNNEVENSSLAKKFVDENTSIDRMYLCSI